MSELLVLVPAALGNILEASNLLFASLKRYLLYCSLSPSLYVSAALVDTSVRAPIRLYCNCLCLQVSPSSKLSQMSSCMCP